MDETWPLSPLNPNSPNNQTYYLEANASRDTSSGGVPSDAGGPASVLIAVVLVLAVMIIFAPMFKGR